MGGQQRSVALWTGLIGYRFNPRWALRAEWGPGFEMCDEDAVFSVGGVMQQGDCHRHDQIANLSALMALPFSTYLIFGPIHVGLGARIPLGDRLAASGELDLGFGFSAASAWPKGLLTTSF